jgi:hypothetical protein
MRNRIVIAFACAAFALPAAAQVTIQTGTSLSNLINNLYGGNGIQLKPNGHQAHFGTEQDFRQFTEALQKTLQARPLFPEPSSVGLISYKFNEETGTYERVQSSFGPILAERATTSGRRHVNFGVSYTFSDVENFNGNDSINLTFHHCRLPECTFGDPNAPFLNDTINVGVRLKLKSAVIATTVIYGLSDRIDVGLVVPYVRNDLNVFTHATITVSPGSNPLLHQFDPTVETPDQLVTGHAIGIGDVIARAKIQLPLHIPIQTAFLADVILPSGDKKNFLGTGDLRVKGTLIASGSGTRIAPHVNVAYEWNTSNARLSSIDYRLGSEFAVTPRVTLVGDLLGIVQPSAASQFTVSALEGETLAGRSQIDFALGAKWQVGARSLLAFNFLTPANSSGIRPNSVITFGLQYGF